MGVGSGLGGQFGFGKETVYGTPVPTDHFLPVDKAGVKLVPTVAQGTGIQPGMLLDDDAKYLRTLTAGTASADIPLQSAGFGLLLQTLMGTTVTPVQQGATTAYLQTHTLADTFGKFLTLQVGLPDTSGVVHPYTAQGCKVVEADFSFDINSTAPMGSSWTFDAQNVVEAPALAAASYPTGVRPFVGTDVTIKVGAYGSEASVDGVSKVDVKIARGMKTNRDYFGNQGLKDEPIKNARDKITGTITADFLDKTVWADRFASGAKFSLVIEAKGALIASTYYQTLRITLPACRLDGDTPELASEDVINGGFPFTCRTDGNLPKIEYITTEVAL